MKTIEKIYYALVSASWFYQLPNKKVIKIEIFYAWMSVAVFLLGYAIGREIKLEVEFQESFYWLITPFLIGMALRIGSEFYEASREVEDYFWKTQLFRFLDGDYSLSLSLYPNASERLKILKEWWKQEYDVTALWVINNPPIIQKLRWVFGVGMLIIGLLIGRYL